MFIKIHRSSDDKEIYLNFDNVLSIVPNPMGGSALILPKIFEPNHLEVSETPAELAFEANKTKVRL